MPMSAHFLISAAMKSEQCEHHIHVMTISRPFRGEFTTIGFIGCPSPRVHSPDPADLLHGSVHITRQGGSPYSFQWWPSRFPCHRTKSHDRRAESPCIFRFKTSLCANCTLTSRISATKRPLVRKSQIGHRWLMVAGCCAWSVWQWDAQSLPELLRHRPEEIESHQALLKLLNQVKMK